MNKYPLELNLWKIEHLEYALSGYRLDSLKYFINNKNKNVKKLTKAQNRNGEIKTRIVYNASDGYKKLLKIINKRLLQNAKLPPGVVGGTIGKTIDDMAKVHCGKEALFVMDFKDFFPNIKSGMVFSFFKRAKCSNEIAGILTDLVTLNKSLPQGFPTSPMVANILAYDLDLEHMKLAKMYNLLRTRWIDDIVFSGRTVSIKEAAPYLVGFVKPSGFVIKNKKIHFAARKEKTVIVGLEVNRKALHVPLVHIHEVNRLLTKCKEEGVDSVQSTYDPEGEGKIKDLKSSLEGRIRFIGKYDSEIATSLLSQLNALEWVNAN